MLSAKSSGALYKVIVHNIYATFSLDNFHHNCAGVIICCSLESLNVTALHIGKAL